MKEHYVSYEQAVALKRLGFAEKVNHGYLKKISIEPEVSVGDLKEVHSKDPKNYNDSRKGIAKGIEFYSAPRLDQAAAWVREEKGTYIEPRFQYESVFKTVIQSPKLQKYIVLENKFYSYEEALKYGLDVAIELLGKEVNNG